jgi:hypothetical protein
LPRCSLARWLRCAARCWPTWPASIDGSRADATAEGPSICLAA